MFETLNQAAAIAARDGVEQGIATLERTIKIKLDDVNEAAKEYFKQRMKDDKEAIGQLVALRAQLNKRVFKAYQDEQQKGSP